MKARVKATGEIINVQATTIEGYDVVSTDGVYFTLDQLELEQKHKIFAKNCLNGIKQGVDYTPDYWTRLEHQAAIAAMQGFLAGGMEDTYNRVAEFSIKQAHALVEKMKEDK